MTILLLFVLLVPAALAEGETYRGKYAGDRRFQKTFRALDRQLEAALGAVNDRLGVRPRNPRGIYVQVEDALPATGRLVPFGGEPFENTEEVWSDGIRVRIVVRPEFVMAGRVELEQGLLRAAAAAVMRNRMEPEAYYATPRWLREGAALWCAGFGDAFVRQELIEQRAFDRVALAFAGLEQGKAGRQRRPEYLLAIDALVAAHGEDALRRLVARVTDGDPHRDALAAVTGLRWNQFVGACETHARARAEALLPPEWDAFRALERAAAGEDHQETRQLAAAFLGAHPESSLLPRVLLLHGGACRRLGDARGGRDALEQLLLQHRLGSDLLDEALLELALGYLDDGKPAKARPLLEELLRDLPDAGCLDRALARLAYCQHALRDDAGARGSAERFLASFPDSPERREVEALAASLVR